MQDEGGQALVEFALVLPVLLAVMIAIFELGTIYRNYLVLTDAVRAGARAAAVNRNAADPISAATSATVSAGNDIGLTTSNVTVTPSTPWSAGGSVTVTATYPYSLSLFGASLISGNLSSSTTERVE